MTDLFDPATGELIEPTPDSVLVCFALYQQEEYAVTRQP